jgi:L-ascorbate metabolism protein UlaG (beta-lactamase superfamily)
VRRFHRVEELAWGESTDLDGLTVESVEVRHWGARMVTDRHRGYGGYLLNKGERTVLFAGDTAYTDAFSRIIMPRRSRHGGCSGRWAPTTCCRSTIRRSG